MNMSAKLEIELMGPEAQILVQLKGICETWAQMGQAKPLDDSEFRAAISRLQSLMVLRAARRNDKARNDWQLL
jgi:hypothetical protein